MEALIEYSKIYLMVGSIWLSFFIITFVWVYFIRNSNPRAYDTWAMLSAFSRGELMWAVIIIVMAWPVIAYYLLKPSKREEE